VAGGQPHSEGPTAGLAGSLRVADQRPATRDPGQNQRPATCDPERPRPGHDAWVTPLPGRCPGQPGPARSPQPSPPSLQLDCFRKKRLLCAPGRRRARRQGGWAASRQSHHSADFTNTARCQAASIKFVISRLCTSEVDGLKRRRQQSQSSLARRRRRRCGNLGGGSGRDESVSI
jgi:hypothetical protein